MWMYTSSVTADSPTNNRGRSGRPGPVGIILDEDCTSNERGLDVQGNENESREKDEPSGSGNLRCRYSDSSIGGGGGGGGGDDDDDPYEYDEDIPRRPLHLQRQDEIDQDRKIQPTVVYENKEDVLVASGASTSSGITPCWDCKGCNPGTPLFVLGSPTDAPSVCQSCQYT